MKVTSATRLIQSGVDKQLIMSNTRHGSVDGIHSYKWISEEQKRISEEQKRSISSVLNEATNGQTKSLVEPKKPRLQTTPSPSLLPTTTYAMGPKLFIH